MSSQTRGNGPPTKECPRARAFEVHEHHKWSREGREDWPFWCDGILPVDEQPPCQFYISPEQPECGEPSPTTIRISNSLINARVDVCIFHKKSYDNRAAKARAERRAMRQAS